MQHNDDHTAKRRRSRTKQTLQGPRHIDRIAAQKLKTMVWVTIGKTEHQAWLLEDVKGKNMVSIRWETTGAEQIVPVLSIRHEAPDDGRRSRRIRTPVQDPYRNLNDANIQAAKKRKRLLANSKAVAETKNLVTQPKQSGGEGSIATSEAKVESKRLAFGASALTDIGGSSSIATMIPKKHGVVSGDNKSIGKGSLTDVAKANANSFSEIWEDAKRTALATYANQSAASTIAKSSSRSSKKRKSKPKEEAQSNKKEGRLI